MRKTIAVLPGDGIGPEVVDQAIKVLKAVGERFNHQFQYIIGLIGADAIDKAVSPLPTETIDICRQADAILLGAVGHPKYDHDPSADIRPEQGLLDLRKELGLFANLRPIHIYRALMDRTPLKPAYIKDVDILFFRELSSGIYFGEKITSANDLQATDVCLYTREEIRAITQPAFEHARKRRKKLTLVDKANVLETSRLWRKVVKEVSAEYRDVEVNYMYVDNAAMQLMLNPSQFDVILTENMFGDILSDEASVLAGSLGMIPSASYGDRHVLFEPVHGSYPEAAGKNIANPMGSILSVKMMLEYFSLTEEAAAVENAVMVALNAGFVTRDINRDACHSTDEVGDWICGQILAGSPALEQHNNVMLGQSTII